MRIENVPNPGTYSGSQQLRVKVAHAISAVENAAARSPDGKAALAENLYHMFATAAAAVQGLRRAWYTGLLFNGGGATVTLAQGVPTQLVIMAAKSDSGYDNVTLRVEYEAGPEGILEVDGAGYVTGVAPGVGTLRATIRGGKGDAAVSADFTVTVTA